MARIHIHTITVAARNPESLARFWMDTLEYDPMPNHTDSVQIGDPSGLGPSLLFARSILDGFGRDRFHLDLRPANQTQAIAEAVARGAAQLPTPSDVTWVRMADPEGNRFCVLQSEEDAAAFDAQHGRGAPSI